jgi:hypothetical protein
VSGQLSHSPFGDSTLFSRMGCAKSCHNTVSEAENDENKILRSGLEFLFNGGMSKMAWAYGLGADKGSK